MTDMIKLIEPDSPSLKVKLENCSEDLNRIELKMKLIEHMKFYQGIGLSANQIGIWERAFSMIRDLEHNEIIVCFNPRIIKSYNEEVEMEEGCLSYPDVFLKVKRPNKIVVKYEDEDKKTHKMKLEGLASRVFQHEYDHMEGIDFTQRS